MTKIDNLQHTYSDGRPLGAAHSTYHYAMGNPIMFNDPLGLKSEAKQGEFQPFWDAVLSLTRENGGRWSSSTGWVIFESSAEGFYEGAATMARNEAWGLYPGWAYSYGEAAANYNGGGNRSQVSSAVSSGGYVIAGGYYRTASGAPTTVNGASGNFAAYYVGGNGSENVRKRHASAFDNDGGGKVNTFGVSFAFGGGYQFEIGIVRDSKGASRTFVSHGPVVGFNLSVGFNEKAIRPNTSRTFEVLDYEGPSSGYSIGLIFGGFEYTGNRNNKAFEKSDLFAQGVEYNQLGFGVFRGIDFGVSWSRTNTFFINTR